MKKIMPIIIFLIIIFINNIVYGAGSISLSASKSSVTVGEEFTISVNLSGESIASLTARIKVDTSKVEYISGPSNSNFNNGRVIYTWTDPNGGASPLTGGTIATFKFRAKSAGSSGFSIGGDFYTPNETVANLNFSGTTVNVKEKEVIPPSTPEPSPEQEKPQTTPNNPSNQQTPNKPNNSTQQNNQNGESVQNLSGNNNLKSLKLDVEGMTPSFKPNTTNYSLVVSENVTNIDVLAITEDSNASIQITGNNGLQMGINTIRIVVTAQNGSKKTYTISVTRTKDAENANSTLENLSIENVTLVPEFRADITEYTAEIGSDVDSLNILAIPQIEGTIVTIEGNENLAIGENIITVLVTAKDRNYYKNIHNKSK